MSSFVFVEPDNCQDCSNDIIEKHDEDEVTRGGAGDVMLGVKTAQMMTWNDMLMWPHLVPMLSYVMSHVTTRKIFHTWINIPSINQHLVN